MNAPSFRFAALWLAPLVFALSACSGLKMPKMSLKMPDINVPFVGDDGTAPQDDPQVPYSLNQALAPGHTLEISAYAGQRSPAKLFSGAVMVDEEGKVDLGKYGQVKVRGLNASRAVIEMEGAFRRKRGESIISVQLKRIEEMPLLQVSGAVARPGVVQFFDDANTTNILSYAGGHKASGGRAVYVTREGVRKFYADFANTGDDLQAGDIVTYSDEL